MDELDFGMIIEQINEYGNPDGYSDEQLGDVSIALRTAYNNIKKAWDIKYLCSNCNYSRAVYGLKLGNGDIICSWCGNKYV